MEYNAYYKQMNEITLNLNDILKLIEGDILETCLDIDRTYLHGHDIFQYISIELDSNAIEKLKFIKTYLSKKQQQSNET